MRVLKSILLTCLIFTGWNNSAYAQKFDKEGLRAIAEAQLSKALQRDTGLPIIYQGANLGAARAVGNSQVWSGGVSGLSLSGNGQLIGYWDAGQPRLTHQEYTGRVSWEESSSGTNNAHATQMVGTMVAAGVQNNAHGMALSANVEAWNWTDDLAEMALEAADNLTLSAHPYIELAGWTQATSFCGSGWTWYSLPSENATKAYQFGYYDSQAQLWDSVAYLAPNYLIVKAAGNQRGEGPETQPVTHWTFDEDLNCVQESTTRELDGGSTGFESVNAASVAKNVLVVGGVYSTTDNFDDLGSVIPISGSGFGPTDDGRIKPDIVAPASQLYTSNSTSDAAYTSSEGTSAATAVVAGSVALIREHYQSLHSDTLSSASIRALLAHTADDLGNTGPDYKTGWGLLNTERAVRFISANSADASSAVLKDTLLTDGNTIELDYSHTSDRPLIVTIAWTDPKGSVPLSGDDPTDIILVNDLDLSVEGQLPWVLDRSNPANKATQGDNDVDNIEQVYISDAASGTYTVTVSHEGTLQSGSQRVSILISEAEPEIIFNTISSGNWSSGSTWEGGTAPSTSLHRAVIKHAVALDTDALVRGVSFEGASAELALADQSLELYGGVFHVSGGPGFSVDTVSSLEILDWDSEADPIQFKPGNQKTGTLVINTEGDTVRLGSSLEVYTKLGLEAGVFDINSETLKLIANQDNTALLEKSGGEMAGEFTYSRLFAHEDSGWRIISSPVEAAPFSVLSANFHTQGGSWAEYTVSDPNSSLWFFNAQDQDYEGYYGPDSAFTSGEGYLFYMFENDPSGSPVLPAALEITGTEPDSIIMDLYRGSDDASSYNLVGNPFAGSIDWHSVVDDGTNLGTSYAVWNPADSAGSSGGGSSGFIYYNAEDGIGDAGRYIAPMQGFFVQSTDSDPELRFRQSHKTSATANQFGKRNPDNQTSFIRFELFDAKGNLLDNQAHLVFRETATSGKDNSDVLRINSLTGIENNLVFAGAEGERRVFEGRSSTIGKDEIAMIPQLTEKGEYFLKWEQWNNIPGDWNFVLRNTFSGKEIDMRAVSEHAFVFDSVQNSQFEIIVTRGAVNPAESEKPLAFNLEQNYPNPFNPVTVISYQLPVNSEVRLAVYDILGREVAVLVDEQKPAGSYNVRFNASGLASGMYFYRLEAGAFVQIRSMMLIK